MKTRIALVGTALYLSVLLNPVKANIADFPQYGFSIEALDAEPSATRATTALMTFLPATEGFAPNVNVNIQPYTGTIESYIKISKEQFKQINASILTEKQNGDKQWNVEYTAQMKGNQLHFYSYAVASNGKVYLVTGTSSQNQWDSVAVMIRKTVDSFKIK